LLLNLDKLGLCLLHLRVETAAFLSLAELLVDLLNLLVQVMPALIVTAYLCFLLLNGYLFFVDGCGTFFLQFLTRLALGLKLGLEHLEILLHRFDANDLV